MRIRRVTPPVTPMYSLTFHQGEGWAIVAALENYADLHPESANGPLWREWARTLDQELRRDEGVDREAARTMSDD